MQLEGQEFLHYDIKRDIVICIQPIIKIRFKVLSFSTIDLNVHFYLINEKNKKIKLVGYTNCNNQLKLKIMIIQDERFLLCTLIVNAPNPPWYTLKKKSFFSILLFSLHFTIIFKKINIKFLSVACFKFKNIHPTKQYNVTKKKCHCSLLLPCQGWKQAYVGKRQ